MIDNPSEVTGFYFLLFQSQLNGYVKCWFDGSEDWSYIPRENVIDFLKKIKVSNSFRIRMESNLDTTSIYLWDVEEEKVTIVTASFEPYYIMGEIEKKRLSLSNDRKSIAFTDSFNNFNFDVNKGTISLEF